MRYNPRELRELSVICDALLLLTFDWFVKTRAVVLPNFCLSSEVLTVECMWLMFVGLGAVCMCTDYPVLIKL